MRPGPAILFAVALLVGCAADGSATDVEPDPEATVETDDGADGDATQDEAAVEPGEGSAATIVGFSFDPATLRVAVGDTVVWTNEDSARHNVTADDESFASDNLAEGETFSHTFDEPGTFDYVCTLHSGMSATVEVG